MIPRPTWRSFLCFLWDYARWCIVTVLLVLLVMGVPLAITLAFCLRGNG